jgi:hypothetical protein
LFHLLTAAVDQDGSLNCVIFDHDKGDSSGKVCFFDQLCNQRKLKPYSFDQDSFPSFKLAGVIDEILCQYTDPGVDHCRLPPFAYRIEYSAAFIRLSYYRSACCRSKSIKTIFNASIVAILALQQGRIWAAAAKTYFGEQEKSIAWLNHLQ